MEDMKRIIAQNIASLRKRNGMTQLDLAEKLNYSDKAVSKWERGDSIPDIMVLKTMADLFGVTVDYLITDEHEETVTEQEELPPAQEPPKPRHRFPFRVHAVITAMSVMLVWLIATFLFFIFGNFKQQILVTLFLYNAYVAVKTAAINNRKVFADII